MDLGSTWFPGHAPVCNLHIAVNLRQMSHPIYDEWGTALGVLDEARPLRPRFYPDPDYEASVI